LILFVFYGFQTTEDKTKKVHSSTPTRVALYKSIRVHVEEIRGYGGACMFKCLNVPRATSLGRLMPFETSLNNSDVPKLKAYPDR
jgi:hypothetical protein